MRWYAPANLTQRIRTLGWLRLGFGVFSFCTGVACAVGIVFGPFAIVQGVVIGGAFNVFALFGGICMFGLLQAALFSAQRRFAREARLPSRLLRDVMAAHPQLCERDADLVLHGLRQFFVAYIRSGFKPIGMPSKVVDTAWHAFILDTKAYAAWCNVAFGRMLHHTPAGVLSQAKTAGERNDSLRRTWYWACKEESIDPRQPLRLPLLFALDVKFRIEGGYHYKPDCKAVGQASDGDGGTVVYCATDFSSGGSGDGGGFSGDGDGFGGSDGGGGDGGGGGCGGGD